METYIALLRGINVSGKNLIKMEDLRAGFADMDYTSCKTYIQSGNIVFDAKKTSTEVLENKVHDYLVKKYKLDVPVLVRSLDYWKQAIAQNPFLVNSTVETKNLHITFLSQAPVQKFDVSKLEAQKFQDDYVLKDDIFYLKVHAGYSDSKLGNAFLEKLFKVQATTRNWNTVCKILELAEKA